MYSLCVMKLDSRADSELYGCSNSLSKTLHAIKLMVHRPATHDVSASGNDTASGTHCIIVTQKTVIFSR